MPLGGFNGTDPSPTLEAFRALATSGAVHWFIDSGSTHDGSTHDGSTHDGSTHDGSTHDGSGPDSAGPDGAGHDTGGSDAAKQIAEWVRAHYEPVVVGGTTLYDLSVAT